MKPRVDITLKKKAKQQRSRATVAAIVEAATYILRDHGPSGFTANKVVEKAGVNIASFYQYFPNKEALLFHVAQLTWEMQLAKLEPILIERGLSHAERLRRLIREFFIVEAAEGDLRKSLKIASINLKDTEEYRALMARSAGRTSSFLRNAVSGHHDDDPDFIVRSIGLLIISFAERATEEEISEATLLRQADLLTDMLITHFKIT